MSTPAYQNALTLVATQIKKCDFAVEEVLNKEASRHTLLNLGHRFSYSETSEFDFLVEFQTQVLNKESGFSLYIEFIAHFRTEKPIDEEFKKSSFVNLSAPAIAFPFLRSFVTTFTANAGFDPIIYPSINFAHSATKEDESKETGGTSDAQKSDK